MDEVGIDEARAGVLPRQALGEIIKVIVGLPLI